MAADQRVRIFRIHRRTRAANNFDGSLEYENRWNSKGTTMLYASTSLALCCLETLVHTVDARLIPPRHALRNTEPAGVPLTARSAQPECRSTALGLELGARPEAGVLPGY